MNYPYRPDPRPRLRLQSRPGIPAQGHRRDAQRRPALASARQPLAARAVRAVHPRRRGADRRGADGAPDRAWY
ncbi:MAG: hypothetical protein MZV65_32105 [Chromatiales bacterium]|nr:hypothetical protein [Chromatiales bacterium]